MPPSLRMAAGILFVLAAAAPAAAQVPARPGSFFEEARVERVIVDAYVTDRYGDPIPDLAPADFRVRVDGKPVALESVDWVPADLPEIPAADAHAAAPPFVPVTLAPPGRLIVFFFQTGFIPSRLVGLVRMSLQARRFLDTLLPTDRVAVVSYDSHLKLRLDVTGDHRKIQDALYDSIRTGDQALLEDRTFPS